MRRIVALLLCTMTFCAQAQEHQIASCHCDACIDRKIGRMLMAGFKGVEPSAEIEQAIRELHLGGVILFDKDVSISMSERNIHSPKQVRELTDGLRAIAQRPLLIAIDQEGGQINRLKPQYGFPTTVSTAYIGRTGSLDTASYRAAQTAKMLVDVGINVNFVPCVDLSINPNNPIIAGRERAFGSDPDSVARMALCWIEEHHKRQIITSLKHFPGHGSSLTDSHLGLTDITATWSERELEPYRKLVGDGYRGIVMVGHLFNANIDRDYPASLSKSTLQGVLRKQIGFEGVIATDDMNMGAIVEHYSLEHALELAINAGVNLIIVGNNAKTYEYGLAARCHAMIKEKIASGDIAVEKIDDSYRRLEALRCF